jgi:hypothetical protein
MLPQKIIYVKLLSLSKEHLIVLKTTLLLQKYRLKGVQRQDLKRLGISQYFNSFFIYPIEKNNLNFLKILEKLENNNFLQILGIIENNILIQKNQLTVNSIYILNLGIFLVKLQGYLINSLKIKLLINSVGFLKEYLFSLQLVSFKKLIVFY